MPPSGSGTQGPPEPAVDNRTSSSDGTGQVTKYICELSVTSTTPPFPSSAALGSTTPDALGPTLRSIQQSMHAMQQSMHTTQQSMLSMQQSMEHSMQSTQQIMKSMQQSMLAMQACLQSVLASTQAQVAVQVAVQENSAIRLHNYWPTFSMSGHLQILAKENPRGTIPVGTKPNYLKDKDKPHAIFPYDYNDLRDTMTASQLDALEEFYGKDFPGNTIHERIQVLKNFIGCQPVNVRKVY